jgi:hypothetical protein
MDVQLEWKEISPHDTRKYQYKMWKAHVKLHAELPQLESGECMRDW